jgi:ribosomal protein S18 acetylase RimI-like enzyme
MRARGELAQLCGAATLPASRRRGVQSALLRRRLSDAQRAGCRLAVMTTQPGSKSQENAARQGFTLLYARNVLRHEPH